MPSRSISSRASRSTSSSTLAPPVRPSSATVPPRRTPASACETVAGLPEHSKTQSTPRPAVSTLVPPRHWSPAAWRLAVGSCAPDDGRDGLANLSLLRVLVRRGAAIVCTIAPRSPAVKATGKQRRLRYHRRAVKATMGTAPERVETLVVGGGIGGLATALALSRQGMPVCVLEQAHEFGEIGAGIQLAPNALRMLERLGLVDRIAANAFYPRKAVLMSAVTGRRLTALDFGVKFREAYGYPYIVMHRSDLLAALLDACPPARWSRSATTARSTDSGRGPRRWWSPARTAPPTGRGRWSAPTASGRRSAGSPLATTSWCAPGTWPTAEPRRSRRSPSIPGSTSSGGPARSCTSSSTRSGAASCSTRSRCSPATSTVPAPRTGGRRTSWRSASPASTNTCAPACG